MAPVAVLLSLLTNCVFCSNADWTYGYSSTERTSMLASGTPESQWCTRSPSPTRLRVQIVTCPADTGSNLCLIAANRTPCRRHPRTRLQSHPHGLLLPQQSTVKVPLLRPCFYHFFWPCFRGHDEAGLLAFSMSLFSDVGPLEAIAENKTEQKSAAKRRQRLLKAPLKPPSYDACFPTARSV